MNKFIPDDKTTKILANFATINPSILIKPDQLEVLSTSKSVIAKYPFPTPFTFEPFGLYDLSDTLGILNAMTKPEIEVCDKYINIIGSNDDKVKYFTTASELVPKVPSLNKKLATLTWGLEFQLTADKLAIIIKMASILKSKYLFFETDSKKIRITVGDELDSSCNNYEVFVGDGITTNNLTSPIKIAIVDFKVLPGEYEVKISERMTSWANLNGVTYYISTAL
jgi:hypothetical protein